MEPQLPAAAEHPKPRKRFNLAHSIAGVALVLVLEGALIGLLDLVLGTYSASVLVIVFGALAGGLFVILMATEVIEEVRRPFHMLVLLSAVVFEFIVFFAFQYWYMSIIAPDSFQGILLDPITVLLQSTMVFAFNPLYMPETGAARSLLLINTLESLVLAFFVLQNVWQFRNKMES